MTFLITAFATFIGLFIIVPIGFAFIRAFGFYTIVEEQKCHVYVLFGKVIAVLDEPGFYLLWFKLGLNAIIVNWLGKCHVVDRRLDQIYLRSQPVNSEEGAPMGIGIWSEMRVADPVNYLFKNADPRGSLCANISNATVRCLSNMPLGDLLENRHAMSQTVRTEVSPKSNEWGYNLGSIYIRKVHFRDAAMSRQIEEKVVNRLRQVTSAIKQDGANQVSIITSTADRQAAIEFAKAKAMRPRIVGEALQLIAQDPEIVDIMFELLEFQMMLDGDARITFVPKNSDLLNQLIAGREPGPSGPPKLR